MNALITFGIALLATVLAMVLPDTSATMIGLTVGGILAIGIGTMIRGGPAMPEETP